MLRLGSVQLRRLVLPFLIRGPALSKGLKHTGLLCILVLLGYSVLGNELLLLQEEGRIKCSVVWLLHLKSIVMLSLKVLVVLVVIFTLWDYHRVILLHD